MHHIASIQRGGRVCCANEVSGMKRRKFITLVGGAAGAWPLVVNAQQDSRMLRVGMVSTQPRSSPFIVAFERRMTELGYQDGRNLAFEFILIPNVESYGFAYSEIVSRKGDVIITGGPQLSSTSALLPPDTIPILISL